MSEEKLQCLEQIKQHLEAEADRMSGKFQLADLEPPATAEKTQKNEESKEEEAKEEVKLNIPTEALPAGRAVNIFEKPSTNIFNTPTSEAASSSKVSENIFMQARTEKSFVNVFYNKASVNLFALKQKEQPQQLVNIFESAIVGPPSVVDDPEDGSSSDVSQQALNEPSEKIMRFTYEQQWNKLGQWRAAKFRAGVGAVKENVLVSLEKESNKSDKVLYLVVRSAATKVILFHAFLLPGARLDKFMGKQQNLKFTVLRQKQQKQEDSSEEVNAGGKKEEEKKVGEGCEREQVKIQFENQDDAVSFEKLITEFNNDK